MQPISKKIILLFALFSMSASIHAQTPALERVVTMTLLRTPLSKVLDSLESQTSVVFSYGSELQSASHVSLSVKNQTIREALFQVLPSDIALREKGDYIILVKKKEGDRPRHNTVSGYVIDRKSEKKIANVSVYEQKSLTSSITNEYGYYELKVPVRYQEDLQLSASKNEYQDTSFSLPPSPTFVNVDILKAEVDSPESKVPAVLNELQNKTDQLFSTFKGSINNLNIKDTLFRKFQFSVFPYAGTNHKLSGKITNNYSMNLIGGYSHGNRGGELGGVFNINRSNMSGVQIAGAFNLTGDTVRGVQIAGAMNMTGSSLKGCQIAGAINVNQGIAKGVMIAGGLNLTGDTTKGVSIAGGANLEDVVSGVQISGGINLATMMRGTQITGGINIADTLKGMQLSGGVNYARDMRGFQLAPVNIANSASGIPFGVFSYVTHGTHQIEFSTDEVFYENLAFRTGVKRLYNIFSVGADLHTTGPLRWQVGYGLGTSFRLSSKWSFDIDLTGHHISDGNFDTRLNDLGKLYMGFEFKPFRKLAIAAGPVINSLFTDRLDEPMIGDEGFVNLNGGNISPYVHYQRTLAPAVFYQGWIGGKVAIRFL